MTNAEKALSRKLSKRFAKKQSVLTRIPAEMGNGFGGLEVPGKDGFVYVTVNGKPEAVYNNLVPNQAGTLVWIGYTSDDPTKRQVLSTRSESPTGAETGFIGYAPAKRYEWHAKHGGQDPLYVHLRALTFLRISVSNTVATLGEMLVNVFSGRVYTGSGWVDVARQDVDVSAHLPSTAGKAAFVLFTIDNTGTVITTKGSEVDIDALAITDVPDAPTGTVFVCGAVRVYAGQEAVQEGRTNTDFVDLRLSNFVTSSSAGGGSGDLAWEIDGALSVCDPAAIPILITKDTEITGVYVYLEDTGSASSTTIDIDLNGAGSIFGTAPSVAYNDSNGWVSATPTTTTFTEGDILTLSISGIATGAAGLRVILQVAGTTTSSVGRLLQYSVASGTTDITTTSTSFVDMTEMSITLTTGDSTLDISFFAGVANATTGKVNTYQILVDGTSYIVAKSRIDTASIGSPIALGWMINVTAGSHTVKVQWKVDGGTGYNRAATTEEKRNLIVREFSR